MKSLLLVLAVVLVGCGSETPSAMTEFKKGVEFAEQGDYDTAIACYTKAIRINPNLAVAQFKRGMAYYKGEEYGNAGMAFDNFAKLFPDDTQISDALFWAGESYRQGNQNSLAFRRYNRCRWDFPVSKAAKDARHRLTLPEMLEQFEAEANKVDHDTLASKAKAAEFNPFLPGGGLGGTPKGGRGGSSQPEPTTPPQATLPTEPQPTPNTTSWVSDPSDPNNVKIETEIRAKLYKPKGELTQADLEEVPELELDSKQLTDVTDLEKLSQLKSLHLPHNKLTDVKGLEKLTRLKELVLDDNQLTDVKGLKNLTKLEGSITFILQIGQEILFLKFSFMQSLCIT